MKKTLPAAIVFLILLLSFPSICVEGAKAGLLLWFNTIIPTLFPFILITNVIRDLGGIPLLEKIFAPAISRLFKTGPGGSYPVVLGFLCGYPMGAKAITDSLSCHRITKTEADYLLSFTNNPSPVYMISYVALFILKAPQMGPLIIVISFLTAMITAYFYRCLFLKKPSQARGKKYPAGQAAATDLAKKPAKGALPSAESFFDQSIVSACELLVKVGGYMILFSVLSACLNSIPGIFPLAACIFCGLLEQTTGLHLLLVQSFPTEIKTALAMVIICFGGLSITAQTYSVIHSQGLSIKRYFFMKLLAGLIAGALALAWFFITAICFN